MNMILTSGYFDVQSCADERHQGGGEVDGHVLVHRHVHQHQPLRDNEVTQLLMRTFLYFKRQFMSFFGSKRNKSSNLITFNTDKMFP